MRIALGADHAGVQLKADIKKFLDDRGVPYTDFGTNTTDSVDYPDFAETVARAVADGSHDRGLLFCGSGIGMAMAANKVPGVRAASAVDDVSTRLSREHNDANVLALGERLTPAEDGSPARCHLSGHPVRRRTPPAARGQDFRHSIIHFPTDSEAPA